MLRRFSVNFALLAILLDGLAVDLGLWLSAEMRPALNGLSFIEPIQAPVYLPGVLYMLFPLTWILIFAALSVYDGRKFLQESEEFSILSWGMLIASVSAAGILYLSFRDVSRALFIAFILLAYVLCLAWRVLIRWYVRVRPNASGPTRRILIVGGGPLGQKVRGQIEAIAAENNLAVLGFIDDERAELQGLELLGGKDAIGAIVVEQAVTDVVIALPHSAYHELGEIVRRLEELPVRVWVALGFFDLALYKTEIEDFAGIPMLDLRASAIDGYQRLLKRGFDIVVGSVLLLFSLPVMAAVALAILLEDGAPFLFRQMRAGENGRLFELLKFRTMVRHAEQLQSAVARVGADGAVVHKTRDDPRVTRVGKLLRRFSLDELPQFFNVVSGSMSLVGPRPELPYLVERYQPWQRKRFAVPPGLTGWWQINGRSDKPMHLHTEDDLYYIQNYSIWLDLQILLRTVWIVLLGRGAY